MLPNCQMELYSLPTQLPTHGNKNSKETIIIKSFLNDSSEYINDHYNNGSSYFFRNRHGNRCMIKKNWEKRIQFRANLFYKEIYVVAQYH